MNEVNMQKELVLNNYAIGFLKETAKWSFFMSVTGFIGIAFMVVVGLFMGTIFSSLPNTESLPFGGALMTFIYLLIAILYFFPMLYLYRFSIKMKASLVRNDEEELVEAFSNLKSHYKFVGILTIVMLSFYAIMLLFGLAAALMV